MLISVVIVVLCLAKLVEGDFKAAYIQSLASTAIQGSKHTIIYTIGYINTILEWNTLHCWQFNPSVRTENYSPCGRILYKHSGNKPNLERWRINVHPGLNINMTFVRFDLRDSLHGCSLEAVSIDCFSKVQIHSERHCGRKSDWDHVCMNKSLMITYANNINSTGRQLTKELGNNGFKGIHVYYVVHENFARRKFFSYDSLPHMENGIENVEKPVRWPATKDLMKDINLSHFPRQPTQFEIYIISVVYNTIYLSWYNDECTKVEIHDGPSKKQPLIQTILTFQTSPDSTIVQLINKADSRGFAVTIHMSMSVHVCQTLPSIKYRTNNRHFKPEEKIILTDVEKFQITNTNSKKSNYFIHGYIFENRFEVNTYIAVDVLNLTAMGPTSDDCRNWGIVITHYEYGTTLDYARQIKNGNFQTFGSIFMLCKSMLTENGEYIPIPNHFVSRTRSIILTWYSYNTVRSPFHASIKIQPTSCAGIQAYCGPLALLSTYRELQEISLHIGSHVYGTLPTLMRLTNLPLHDEFRAKHASQLMLSVAALWVYRTNGHTIINAVTPYEDTQCIAAHYLPYYYYWNKPTESCSIGIKLLYDYLKYEFQLKTTTQLGQNCEPSSGSIEGSRGYKVYKFNPHCGTISLQAKISMYPMKLFPQNAYQRQFEAHLTHLYKTIEETIYNNTVPNLPYIIQAEHSSRHTHFELSLLNNMFGVIKTYQFGGEWFLRKWAQLGTNFQEYSETVRNVSVINMTLGTECYKLHSGSLHIKIYFAVPSPADGAHDEFDHFIVHNLQYNMFFTQPHALTLSHLYVFGMRWLFVQPLKDTLIQEGCKFTIDLNPFYPLKDAMDVHHHYVYGQYGGDDTTYYYVIWEYKIQSWREAEERCQSIGGHLPIMTTHEEMSFLENVVMGTRFNSPRPPFLSPIRIYPYAGVFIGNHVTSVSFHPSIAFVYL